MKKCFFPQDENNYIFELNMKGIYIQFILKQIKFINVHATNPRLSLLGQFAPSLNQVAR